NQSYYGGPIHISGNIDTTGEGDAPSGAAVTLTSTDAAITGSGVINAGTAGSLTAIAMTGISLAGLEGSYNTVPNLSVATNSGAIVVNDSGATLASLSVTTNGGASNITATGLIY